MPPREVRLRCCGPSFVWIGHLARHVPRKEGGVEVNIGIAMVSLDMRVSPSFEYTTAEKSLVISKPDTRTG